MTDYLRQTKSNIEEKMREEECDNTSDCEFDPPPVNFIIDNFKGAQNTFNVILAQRENDLQRITQLSIKNEQQRSEIDKLDTQKYQFCLDNANLRLEIEDMKTKTAVAKKLSASKLARASTIAMVSIIFNCIMVAVLAQW
jgi:hypothetical protein